MHSRIVDPRWYQVAILSVLLILGAWAKDISYDGSHAFAVLFGVIFVQALCICLFSLPLSSLKSALITGGSLILLLRGSSYLPFLFAAAVAIGSKRIFCTDQKHFFNPANFGIIVTLYIFPNVWVSPGQWGTTLVLSLWIMLVGIALVTRVQRFDVSLSFLLTTLLLLGGRNLYLGFPIEVTLHQVGSGALLIFTFLMISDPRSTPNHRLARLGYGFLVASIYHVLWFQFYWNHALFLALFLVSPLTPILDKMSPSAAFQWHSGGVNADKALASFHTGDSRLKRPRILRLLRGEGWSKPL